MSFDPSTIVSLIQNCKKLYDYFSDVKHSSAERDRLLDEVHALQPELEALQRLANAPSVAGDQASMERLGKLLDPSQPFAKVVGETLARVEDVLTYGTSDPNTKAKLLAKLKQGAAALRWTVDKVEVKDLLSDLGRYKDQIGLALQHDMFTKQVVMDGKLDIVEKNLSNKDRLKIAKFISESDFTGHQKGLLEQRLKKTGTWMIQHPKFVAWRDDKESPRTLWCHGHPGAGKSIIAALIVDHLQSKNNIVLSVFCRYSSDNFPTPFPVLRGLLRQLIQRSTAVPSTICERYWKGIHPTPDDLPRFLAEAAAIHARPIYIVVDALDECKIGIDLLRAIQQLGPLFRVLVTSRPVFKEIQKHQSVKIRASDKDILIAVDTTLLKLEYPWLDEELKRKIRAEVLEKADGMFLLASLQLRELERDVTSQRDVVAILDSLPRTLDDAYKATFQRIREQGDHKNELACRALALIASNSVLFDTDNIQELLADGDSQWPDVETILQCCYGLIKNTTSWDDHLAFIHYSVHEYITEHWWELFPEHPNQLKVFLDLCHLGTSLSDLKHTKSQIAPHSAKLKRIITEYRLKIAKSFSKRDFASHHWQQDLLQQKLENTGTWLMQDSKFVAWRDDRESSRMLWCYGHLGAGKSVMAASIVDHLQTMGAVVLSVFRKYSSDIFTTPHSVFCGLLRQLIEKSSKVLPAICNLYETQTHPNPDTVSSFLSEIAASHAQPIYIVIDALDECQIALELLRAIQQLGPSFRILVTSRPVFEEIKEHPSIKIRASDEDILIAIDTTLQKLKHAWFDQELKNTIREKVVEKADGMFLLASLQLRELEREVTSQRDVVAILDSLPHTLHDAYALTFRRIREQGKRKNELACCILALTAFHPVFSLQGIQGLLQAGDTTQYTDLESLVQCCQGLVYDNGDLEITHGSVHEYTTTHWLELFPENPNPSKLCLELGYSCLTAPDAEFSVGNDLYWSRIVSNIDKKKPKELNQIISMLSTPAARAALVERHAELAPFVHDPLLIACYYDYSEVACYMIETAPPDVQRFNEALHASRFRSSSGRRISTRCLKYINARPDMRVNSDGVVVAVDPNGGEENRSLSNVEEDETSADGALIQPYN